jgi:hypothetical protein
MTSIGTCSDAEAEVFCGIIKRCSHRYENSREEKK